MAARRAAARAAAAAERESEKKEEKKSDNDTKAGEKKEEESPEFKKSLMFVDYKTKEEEERKDSRPRERVVEKITERIILCSPGQNPCPPTPCDPYMSPPCPPYPPQGYCNCPPEQEITRVSCQRVRKRKVKKVNRERKRLNLGKDGLCKHPYCVMQRAKLLNQPLCPGPCHPLLPCCCPCRDCPDSDSSDCSDSDPEVPCRSNSATQVTFLNMVFAAANVMNERANVFCDL